MVERVPTPDITIDRLRDVFDYAPITGKFYYRKAPIRAKLNEDGSCGRIGDNGFRFIYHSDKRYTTLRLAWFYVNGTWPPKGYVVSTRNGDRDDSRFENLRLRKIKS